jgi:hypothetical protein
MRGCCGLFLALIPQPGIAEWHQIDHTEHMVVYLDVDNISHTDSTKRSVRNLVDFFIPQVAQPDGHQITFQSFVREIEVDCDTHQQKTLNIIFFERINASGREVFRAEINAAWRINPSTTGNTSLVNLACISSGV